MGSGQLSLLPSVGWEMSLRATGWGPSVVDWGGGMSAFFIPRVQLFADAGNGWPRCVLRYHQLMPISCHFRDCKSASGLESVSCKKRYSKYWTLPYFILPVVNTRWNTRRTAVLERSCCTLIRVKWCRLVQRLTRIPVAGICLAGPHAGTRCGDTAIRSVRRYPAEVPDSDPEPSMSWPKGGGWDSGDLSPF